MVAVVLARNEARHIGGFTDEILVYDPAADNLTVNGTGLPEPAACRAYCLAGGDLLLFGGEKAGEPRDDVGILRLGAVPPAPAPQAAGTVWDIAAAGALVTAAGILVALTLALVLRRR